MSTLRADEGADMPTSAPPVDGPRREPPGSAAARLRASLPQRMAVLGVWAVMIGVFSVIKPSLFLTSGTFQTIFGSQQALVFLALALVITFAVGEIDLSVPSTLGLSATLVPVLHVLHHVNLGLSVVIAIAAAIAVGVVNGLIVVRLGVDPFVTTLGMSTLLLGLALWLSDLTTVGGLPSSFATWVTKPVGGLPLSFYYGLAVTLVFAYIMWRTPLGRRMTFTGANREVARLAGIRVNRVRIGSFVFAGLTAGVGGVVLVAGVGGYDPNSSATYLLPAFAAAFLSTAVIVPGRFNPVGAWIAIYFLETGIVGLQLLGYSGWISDVFFGASLVVAVAVSTVIRKRSLTR
jgi:ribose transport system permease protein